jgi:hypothetical protein
MSVFIVRAKLSEKCHILGNNTYAFPTKEDALGFIDELSHLDLCEYEWIECMNGKLKGNKIVYEGEKK